MSINRRSIALVVFFIFTFITASYCQQYNDAAVAMRRIDSLRLLMNPALPLNTTAGTGNPGVAGNLHETGRASKQQVYPGRPGNGSGFVACFDTSARSRIGKDSIIFYAGQSILSADGNVLIPGQYSSYSSSDQSTGGFLIKADIKGNVIWAKFYDSVNAQSYHWLNYYQVLELQDGSILLGGAGSEPVSQNADVVLTKTDALGNVIWTKDYYSRLWTNGSGSADYFYIHQWAQDPQSGDIIISGPTWAKGIVVMRLDATAGNAVWSNTYMLNSNGYANDRIAGLLIRQNEIVAFASYSLYNAHILIYRINKANGDTISTKMLSLQDTPYYKFAFINPEPLQLLNDGNIALSGPLSGSYSYQYNGVDPLHQAGVVILDSAFNFNKAYCLRNNIENNSYNSRVTLHPDGSGVFNMLKVTSGFTGQEFITQFRDGNIIKQRTRLLSNEGMPREPLFNQLNDGGEIAVKLVGDSIKGGGRLVFSRMHLSDTSSSCMGFDNNITSMSAFVYKNAGTVYADSIRRSIFRERRQRLVVSRSVGFAPPDPVCRQSSFCDTLSLSSPVDTICTNMAVLIHVNKNKECGTMVELQLNNPQVAEIVYINDSTFRATFRQSWEGYLYGKLPGCKASLDSIFFKVYANPDPLDLGPDTTICAGNSISLVAQPGYTAYLWQNGSNASQLSVTVPGTYSVAVTDGCGNRFYDTVVVAARQASPLDAGPDRTICRGDGVILTATAGFTGYHWSPSYNISSTSAQAVNVSPFTDTVYTVKAEKTPGCFSFDTVRIKVNAAPPIVLERDQAICSGQTVTADAGPGFNNYTWSNGSAAQQIVISTSGQYRVVGTTADGCKAYDTINVTVNPNPVVNLGPDGPVCINSNRGLNAGNGFASYAWNNGQTSPAITVSAVDTYWVTVTDSNHCTGTDTITITALLPLPASFLPLKDTSLCSYGSIDLKSSINYVQYLWNTGSNAATITIRQPGQYWLQVTDKDGCKGKDSIQVKEKQCLTGLYVPSAFTPNADHINDQLKALIFGNIRFFEFSVYNRYSELVFKTNDPSKGWNGNIKGIPQETGNFVWICRYRLNSEPEKIERGNTILIR